jgi:Glycosyl transferase family 2
MAPLISVVLDTYNHEKFIAEAIASALQQDFPKEKMEILVVDDGSTDRTPEIVRDFEPDVHLLQKKNGGQASAINFGVAHAKGTLVAFLDGDDVWLPNKLSRVAQEFEKDPRIVMAYHNFVFWDATNGNVWAADDFHEISGDVLADRRKLLEYWAAPTSSLTFRREALQRLLPTPEKCSFSHDAYLTNTAIFLGPVACVPEILTKNRVHGQNLWFAGKAKPNPEALQRRIETRAAAIESIRNWTLANAPRSTLPQARILLRQWRLLQDLDEFRLKPPGRLRFFLHRARHNMTYRPVMTRARLAYRWTHALLELIVGRKHSHYLEGVRTRINKLRARRAATAPTSETAGHVR